MFSAAAASHTIKRRLAVGIAGSARVGQIIIKIILLICAFTDARYVAILADIVPKTSLELIWRRSASDSPGGLGSARTYATRAFDDISQSRIY
jgi:hypothetical protein